MLFADVVAASRRVSEARGRNAKIAELAACLGTMTADEVRVGVAYLSGELPQRKLGVGWAGLREAAAEACAARPALTLLEVDEAMARVASESGAGSARRRLELLTALFRRATAEEQALLRGLVLGGVRQGAQEGLMVDAIARAARVPASDVRRAVMLSGDAGDVARAALARGAAALSEYRLELLRPVSPMLAQTADDPAEALARLERAALEHKLDGARVQVHRAGDDVRVFSRAGNDVSRAVPELVRAVQALPARSLVLDGEAIALRPDGAPHPFQTTMRRFGRRVNVDALRDELPLSTFFYDVLHVDGEDVLERGASERVEVLAAVVPEAQRVPRVVTSSALQAQAFLADAIAAGHEGVMAKSLSAPYEAGRRGASWLKIKPAHALDLVVLAVEQGSGRRRQWLSNLHLGARDPAHGGFVMLGKTFKGMTDEMLMWQTQRFSELAVGRDGHVVHVRPEQVVEIAFDGVQTSPHYPGGLALRFARVKRYRPDKAASEADTIDTVRAIHAVSGGDRSAE